MTPQDFAIIREVTTSLGFAGFMALVFVVGMFSLGAGKARSQAWLVFFAVYFAFFCFCLSMWAQNLSWHPDPQAIEKIGYVIGVLAFSAIVGMIVQRAPPAVLVTILAILVGGALSAALILFAPTTNLIILLLIVLVVGLVVVAAMSAWLLDRRDARVQRQPVIDHAPQPAYLPREANRGQLSGQKSNLPAVRNDKGQWLT